MLHVEQEVTGDATSVLNSVLAADGERVALLAQEAALLADPTPGAAARLPPVYARLAEIDAYTAEARAGAILAGLGFDEAAQGRATASFSGGWRMRVALARALFVVPDLLCLDEPTNHLDWQACAWLEATLMAWPTTLLVVSHARVFLDSVCTDIIHLTGRRLTRAWARRGKRVAARREGGEGRRSLKPLSLTPAPARRCIAARRVPRGLHRV